MHKIRGIDIAAMTVEEALEIFNDMKDEWQREYGCSDSDIISISARSAATERRMLAERGGKLQEAKVVVSF